MKKIIFEIQNYLIVRIKMKNYYALNSKMMTNFNEIYYGVPHNSLFKLKYIGEWMQFYGYWLKKEHKHSIPMYYTTFKRGSIVMVNFGANVGSELSGNHFAIVLNKTDKQENRLLTVVPLSSKDHSNYLALGKELMASIATMVANKGNELSSEIKVVSDEIHKTLEEINPKSLIYNLENVNFDNRAEYIFRDSLNGYVYKMNNLIDNLDDYIVPSGYKELEQLINDLSKIRDESFDKYKDEEYKNRLSATIDPLKDIFNLQMKTKKEQERIDHLKELSDKLQRYSKNTFVVIPNVTTVSKLRVVKVSKYTISKNVVISDESLNKVSNAIKNFQGLNE